MTGRAVKNTEYLNPVPPRENGGPVVKFYKKAPEAALPSYETEGAAGMDIRAFLPGGSIEIPPLGREKIPTGLFMEIPKGFEAQIRPRSGLADRFGVTVLNAPGTIDSDFRGEIQVILVNFGREIFTVKNGDRIAQMVIAGVQKIGIAEETGRLSETKRGRGGFGSTGI